MLEFVHISAALVSSRTRGTLFSLNREPFLLGVEGGIPAIGDPESHRLGGTAVPVGPAQRERQPRLNMKDPTKPRSCTGIRISNGQPGNSPLASDDHFPLKEVP
jgi:hypothetical protein